MNPRNQPSAMSGRFLLSKKNVEYKSSSIQVELVDVDAEIVDLFHQTQTSVDDSLLYFEKGPGEKGEEYGKEDEPHITVLYGFSNPKETDEIVSFLKTQRPFEATFGRVSLFEGNGKGKEKPYDVVKVEIDGDGIHALHDALSEAGFELKGVTFPDYKPHTTLAYVKVGSLDPASVDNLLEGQSFIVGTVHLSAGGNGRNIPVRLEGREVLLSSLEAGEVYSEQESSEEWPDLDLDIADDMDNLFDGSPGEDRINGDEDEDEDEDGTPDQEESYALEQIAASWVRSDKSVPFKRTKQKPTKEELESEEFHKHYGLERDPKRKNDQIGKVAHEKALREGKQLGLEDFSEEARNKMVERLSPIIRKELQKNKSAAIWYTKRYSLAMEILQRQWPELSNESWRGFFSAIVGISSSGVDPKNNMKMACAIYAQYLRTKTIAPVDHIGTMRPTGLAKGTATLDWLKDFFSTAAVSRSATPTKGSAKKDEASEQAKQQVTNSIIKNCGEGIPGMVKFLLSPAAVKDHKIQLRALGLKADAMSGGWGTNMVVPMSAVLLGPKVGNFFANLSGYVDVVTTDDWFAREFNEHRGQLYQTPKGGEEWYSDPNNDPNIEVGLRAFKRLIGHPEYSDAQALEEAERCSRQGAKLGYTTDKFKSNILLKTGNDVWNNFTDPIEVLRGVPASVGDRKFMQEVVDALAKKILAESGTKLSASAIQAILWVYTRRKYAMLRGETKGNEDFAEGTQSLAEVDTMDFAINPHRWEKREYGTKGKTRWTNKETGFPLTNKPPKPAKSTKPQVSPLYPEEEPEEVISEETAGMAP